MNLDPDPEEMRRLGYEAVDLLVDWLRDLPSQPVARMPRREVLEPLVAEDLPERGLGLAQSMERFFADLLPAATLVNHPRFFAYIPCPGSYAGALGSFLAAGTNLFTSTWLGGAVAAQLEEQVLGWLAQALGLPGDRFSGCLQSGGSMANLSALAAARSRLPRADWGRATILLSEQGHHSLAKAARLLGFDDAQLQVVACDAEQRMDPAALRSALAGCARPLCVAATLGTTNTGAIDPLAELGAICREAGVWFHVDGAYGAACLLLEDFAALRPAVAQADSLTLDPHKWLYSPFESGCLLTPHKDALHAAFDADGGYMQDIPREEINLYRRGAELSRGNRALKLWLMLRGLGLAPIRAAIAEDIRLCRLARDLLAADPRFVIRSEPELSVFSFAVEGGEAAGKRLLADVLEDGHLMLSSTRIDGEYVLRFCVLNHRCSEADIHSAVARLQELLPAG